MLKYYTNIVKGLMMSEFEQGHFAGAGEEGVDPETIVDGTDEGKSSVEELVAAAKLDKNISPKELEAIEARILKERGSISDETQTYIDNLRSSLPLLLQSDTEDLSGSGDLGMNELLQQGVALAGNGANSLEVDLHAAIDRVGAELTEDIDAVVSNEQALESADKELATAVALLEGIEKAVTTAQGDVLTQLQGEISQGTDDVSRLKQVVKEARQVLIDEARGVKAKAKKAVTRAEDAYNALPEGTAKEDKEAAYLALEGLREEFIKATQESTKIRTAGNVVVTPAEAYAGAAAANLTDGSGVDISGDQSIDAADGTDNEAIDLDKNVGTLNPDAGSAFNTLKSGETEDIGKFTDEKGESRVIRLTAGAEGLITMSVEGVEGGILIDKVGDLEVIKDALIDQYIIAMKSADQGTIIASGVTVGADQGAAANLGDANASGGDSLETGTPGGAEGEGEGTEKEVSLEGATEYTVKAKDTLSQIVLDKYRSNLINTEGKVDKVALYKLVNKIAELSGNDRINKVSDKDKDNGIKGRNLWVDDVITLPAFADLGEVQKIQKVAPVQTETGEGDNGGNIERTTVTYSQVLEQGATPTDKYTGSIVNDSYKIYLNLGKTSGKQEIGTYINKNGDVQKILLRDNKGKNQTLELDHSKLGFDTNVKLGVIESRTALKVALNTLLEEYKAKYDK